MAQILILEPFYGGSHKYFADGLKTYSRHSIEILPLPGRFWKWRMEGAALALSRMPLPAGFHPDIIMATNLMDLAQWKSFKYLNRPYLSDTGYSIPPHILYVHENQLDYPLSPGEKRDFHYVWKDYCNYLTADAVLFNSDYNRQSFIKGFTAFRRKLPDVKPAAPEIFLMSKSEILPQGCHLPEFRTADNNQNLIQNPVILWNHRWEHDKNPEAFFRFLDLLKRKDHDFRLILLGESYNDSPECFQEAKQKFKSEIIHYGFAPGRAEYEEYLRKADFVISTSKHENFGISMVEAMAAGALPLLPDRLAYPEVLPRELHQICLYQNEDDLYSKFLTLVQRQDIPVLRKRLSDKMGIYDWTEVIKRFDRFMDGFL